MPDGRRIQRRGSEWIGRRRIRVEDQRLLMGGGRYVDDIRLPGCLHVAFVRSVHAHAHLNRIDTTAAATAPGVVAVFTADDLGPLGSASVNPLIPSMAMAPLEVLAKGTARAVGQAVAAVVAETPGAALDAVEDIEVDYAVLEPQVANHRAAIAQGWSGGDVDAAFRNAAHVVRVRIAHARVAPTPLEPRTAMASWDAEAERLTAWFSTQTPHRARHDLATILSLDEARIRVIAPDVGGAFGGKASLFPEDAFVAWAAMRLGRPVRWRGTRGEDLLSGTHGRGGTLEGELALSSDGIALGLRARLSFPLGHWMPYSSAVPGRNAARILPGPYGLGAVDIRLEGFLGNTAATGIYRGAGRPEAAMLMERLMDLAARDLNIDPAEIRRRNVTAGHAVPRQTPTGESIDSGDYAAVLESVLALADYRALRRMQIERREAGTPFGIGLGLYIEPCGQGWESAAMALTRDGKIIAATGATAQGQGRETAYAQIVADVLHVSPDAVTIRHGDTDETPPGIGALASRSTAIGGAALVRAAQELRAKACAVAARLLRVPVGDVLTRDGGFALLHDEACRLDWAAVASAAESAGEDLAVATVLHAEGEAWSSGCCVAAVAIDAETGVATVEKIWWVDDAGTVINPMLVEGQLLGGLAQGLGEALMEQIVYDEAGQLLTGSLMDYAMPRADDIPSVALASCMTPSPTNVLGAKGVGEAGCIGVPAAIVNAIVDALAPFGVRHIDMPLTSEKIWRAMRATKNEEDET